MRVTPGVADGPKGLILNPLDRYLFGPWLAGSGHTVQLLGAPLGTYCAAGITGYHLHLPYDGMADGPLLYPHIQRALVPGWLDKGLKHRHHASSFFDQVLVVAPHPDGVRLLPGGKLPERQDVKTWRCNPAGLWRPGPRLSLRPDHWPTRLQSGWCNP